MGQFFTDPRLLLLGPLYVVFLWQWQRLRRSWVMRGRMGAVCAALHIGAAVCLILAASGFSLPHAARRIKLVVAADVSDSILDLGAQTARVRELLSALEPGSADVAVVVFGESAGLERAWGPLPDAASRPRDNGGALPDLGHLTSVVGRSATNIGGGISFSRGLFSNAGGPRGILLLSDFRDTRQRAEAAAAALQGTGVDLLVTPAIQSASQDVQLVSLRLPDAGAVGRALPVEVTIAAMQPVTVRVSVWRDRVGQPPALAGAENVMLALEPGMQGVELRKTIRILDYPETPGTVVYTVHIGGVDGPLPGDISINNKLSAATLITGPSHWAVLTRPDSTLARLCAEKALGVETELIFTKALPVRAAAYDKCAGILVDGLSAEELPPASAALRALREAVEGGKGLVALGGAKAFGAGQHPRDGDWERLLPVEMTPEDDRTRAVLFLIDVSKSMADRMRRDGGAIRKMDFAAEQLAQAVEKLRPQDRLGLITFSGSARIAAQLSSDPSHAAFLTALNKAAIESNTDFSPPLALAKKVLDGDDAEEQLVILLSDGIQTVQRPREELIRAAEALCPAGKQDSTRRRTMLYTFGIGAGEQDSNPTGEALLKELAGAGGGQYSPDFLKLGERLEKTLAAGEKDFYVRHEPFAVRAAYEHPVLAGAPAWPLFSFRNRVKAKPDAETLLWSARPNGEEKAGGKGKALPDPLLALSGAQWAGISRRAVLALTLDGSEGEEFLTVGSGGRRLLPALLDWVEGRSGRNAAGRSLTVEPGADDTLEIELRASDLVTHRPASDLKPRAHFTPLSSASDAPEANAAGGTLETALHPVAPGVYRAVLRPPSATTGRLSIFEGQRTSCERFVSTPCAAEVRRFGVDRAAMLALAAKAGGQARAIEGTRDLAQWAAEKGEGGESFHLRPWLIALAMALLFAEYAARGAQISRRPH